MSSFIVNKTTIDRIITGMINSKITEETDEICILDYSAFGQDLLDMNTNAVNQRYDESNHAELYTFNKTMVTDVQAFKSLRCLMYQCSEGDVPNSELYKQMDDIGERMAVNIVYKLPSYDKAEWD